MHFAENLIQMENEFECLSTKRLIYSKNEKEICIADSFLIFAFPAFHNV